MSSFVELQNDLNVDDIDSVNARNNKRNYKNKCVRFLRNRIVNGVCFLIIFSLTIPVLLFFILFHVGYSVEEQRHTCLVANSYRVSCGRVNITLKECTDVDCCFDEDTEECYHYVPSRYFYQRTGDESTGYYYAAKSKTPFNSSSTNNLAISVVELNENNLKIILHRTNVSFETNNPSNKSYAVKIHEEDFVYVQVTRVSTNETLFTTHKGPLIASVGYWEWTFQLTTEQLFGLGELIFEDNRTYTKVIYKNRADYNSLPMFMAYVNGRYHGAVVEHEGPLEVTVLPSRLVILRALVGDSLSIVLSMGPTPSDVIKQQRVSGDELLDLPFWALGPHICRKAGDNLTEALEHYYNFFETDSVIDYASDCIHENLIFLLQKANDSLKDEVREIVDNIRNNSRFMLSFQPQVVSEIENLLFNTATDYNLLYKDSEGNPFTGSYKASDVVFIDFDLDNAFDYFVSFHDNFLSGIEYDGVTFIDNWPAEDSYIMPLNHSFPFVSEHMNASLSKTIPWNATSNDLHLIKHNSYATSQLRHFKSRTKFLMTAAYDYGTTNVAALIQDTDTSWEDLRKTIKTVLYHSIFGGPLISVPICGSTNNYDAEKHETICMRWYIVAATSPIFRISSDLPLRDPQHLTTGHAKNVALKAIAERKKLSLYFHTVLKSGEPLMRPMFYDFFDDNNTLNLDTQYMVGSKLLVAQILLPVVNTISVYLPPKIGVWYEFFGGGSYNELGWRLFSVVETDWLMFIAQGAVIPLRNDAGFDSAGTITLAIALNCTEDSVCSSAGKLQYQTVQIFFLADANSVKIINANDIECDSGNDWPTVIENVIIYGMYESLVEILLQPPVDLCDIFNDEYVFNYYNEKLV